MNYANAIKTAIIKLYRNRNKYLFYNMIKMLLYIYMLLLIIFVFIPHKAYIVLESSSINNLNVISNTNENNFIQSNNLDRLDIQLMKNGKLILHLENVTIENDKNLYVGDYDIVFGFSSSNTDESYQVHFNRMNDTYLNVEMFNLENLKFSFPDKMKSGLITYLTSNADLNIDSSFSITIPDEEYVLAYIIEEDNKRIPLGKCNMFFDDSYANIVLKEGEFGIMTWHTQNGKSDVSISSISGINVNCDGELFFSYNPENVKYGIHYQDIKLDSKNNNLVNEFVYDFKTGYQQLLIRGYTDKAFIASNDLFPSFIGWFKSNIYMIPLTLVSAVIGGVTLTYKRD